METLWAQIQTVLWNVFNRPTIADVLDILIVAFLLYELLMLTKETRASAVLKGLVTLVVASWVSDLLGLTALNWVLLNVVNNGAVVLVILFQPELRKALETAIERLETQRQRNRHFEWAIAQIGNRREFLREEFLREAASGQIEADEIRDFRVYFDFPEPARLMLMLVCAPVLVAGEKPWQYLLQQYALQDAMFAAPAELAYHCLFSDDRGNVLMLYDAPEQLDESICAIARDTLGEAASIVVQPVASLTRLAEAYDAAIEKLLGSAHVSPVVQAAKRFIAQNYARPELGLNAVAEALSVHPVHLSRLMKRELGIPFAKYLTNIRITKAIELMRDPNKRIWQIAELVGYSGGNYFSVAFKKVLGVSPADYRLEGHKR